MPPLPTISTQPSDSSDGYPAPPPPDALQGIQSRPVMFNTGPKRLVVC